MTDERRPPSRPGMPGVMPPPRRPSQPRLSPADRDGPASTLPPPDDADTQRRPSYPELKPARRPTPSEPRRALPATTPQEAALYDAVVVPRWSQLFGRMLLARVPQGERAQVLDVGCGTGHPAFEVLRKLGEGGRVIAIDRDVALIDLARRRALDAAGKKIFFKVEPVEHMSFGDEVFDLVVGNLVLGGIEDEGLAYGEIRRVMMPGARLILTRPLGGTFEEVHDMFRELAVRKDLAPLQRRIDQLATRHPSAVAWRAQLAGAGFEDVDVSVEEIRLPFHNARELFADPMLRVVAMPEWRWLCGMNAGDEALLGEAEKALDTYFAGGPLTLTVKAGIAEARKP